MTKTELKTTFLLAGIYASRMLGLFLIFPTFSLLVQGLENVTAWKIGLALGIYGFAQAALQIPAGILSDIIGRKKVLLLGLVLFFLGSVLAAVTEDINSLIFARLLQGMGAVSAVCLAYVADGVRGSEHGKAMMIIGISIALSFVLSFVFGSMIAVAWGLAGLFILTALLALLAIIFAYALPPTSQILTVFKLSEFIAVAKNGRLFLVNIQIALLHLFLSASFFLFPILLELNFPDENPVYLYVIPILIAFFGVLLVLRKSRTHVARVLPVCWLVLTVSFVLFSGQAAFQYANGFMLALGVFFFAFTLLEALLPSRLFQLSGATSRGATSGIFSVYQFSGNFLGALVGAKLYTLYGENATMHQAFYVLAAVSLIITLLTFILNRKDKLWQVEA